MAEHEVVMSWETTRDLLQALESLKVVAVVAAFTLQEDFRELSPKRAERLVRANKEMSDTLDGVIASIDSIIGEVMGVDIPSGP